MIFWLMGISGSGKTTLGLKLKSFFEENHVKAYMIDGDEVRSFFDNDLGYSKEERMLNVKRIILAASLLEKNGITTIVCNISPFEDLRQFCKRKIRNYRQIYLKKSIRESMQSDVKNIYGEHHGKTPLVGVDIVFEEPAHSDLIIDVDKRSLDESFSDLLAFVKGSISK